MPHDLNGKVLNPGDKVSMEFVVKVVHAAEDFCNMDLESVEVMPGNGLKTTLSCVNTKMVKKLE